MNTNTAAPALRAAGMNDEQTECDACGREELRGTVIVVDEDGNEVGRYGTTCASRVLGVKVTRSEVVSIEASRRQAVVHTLRQAMNADTDRARAWWLGEVARYYTLHRADERRTYTAQRALLAECWAVTVPELEA